jgi:tagaturonate reductase
MFDPFNRRTTEKPVLHPERIVQFGGGNFLRAFVDWMVDILNEQADFASSVVIVKPTPQGDYNALNNQQGLFQVRLHGLQDGQLVTDQRIVSCVTRALNPYTETGFEAYLRLARQPEIRFIVSNTTEAGIAFNPDDRPDQHPPASFPAKLTQFLYVRFRHFAGATDKGCIVLPCELIEYNGTQLQQFVLQYATLWELEPEFAAWIEAHNVFCNTLVDRIVTGFPPQNSAEVAQQIVYDDRLLVEGEQYHSWIIEAPDWIQSELPFDKTALNVKIIADSAPYRELKVRILNGAHTAMVAPGYMLGLTTVRESIDHPDLGQFIHELLFEEIIPALNAPELNPEQFAQDVLNRFYNPFIQHRLLSIALNSIPKFKARLLPSLLAYHAQFDQLPPRIVFAFAALLRFYKGEWQGQPIPLKDDEQVIHWLKDQWATQPSHQALAEVVLVQESLWGQDLTRINGLVDLLSASLDNIETHGMVTILANKRW